MPRSASQVLIAAGHDVDTVVDEDLAGATDPQVVAAAAATGRLLITLDRGLGDIRAYPPGSHAGILVLRPSDQSPPTVAAALAEVVAGHDLTMLAGTVAVAQRGLLRIRRLQERQTCARFGATRTGCGVHEPRGVVNRWGISDMSSFRAS